MKYKAALEEAIDKASSLNKEESACLFLLEYVTGKTTTELFLLQEDEMDLSIYNKYQENLNTYFYKNIPVQYITGLAPFYGYDFHVNKNVLIPRRETEELVENILHYYDKYFKGENINVCDIGTGSGCIAITLKKEEPHMNLFASDISKDALEVAKLNAHDLGADVTFKCGDMLTPFMDMKFDILVSNPPYIPSDELVDKLVLDNEPNLALFGGSDGLKFYRIILSNANQIMNEKCMLCFEHGYDKKNEIEDICKKYFPSALVFTLKDMQGLDRMTFVIRGVSNE